MGHHRARTPRLGEKLREIRKRMELTQNELVEKLGLEKDFDQERISKYERAILEPPIYVLIAYSDLAGVSLDVLLRSEYDIPDKLPARAKSSGLPRPAATTHSRRKTKGDKS
jgi:transcriptional regulator with XRE-family HTH domain